MHMTVNIDRYIEDMEQWKKTKEENEKLQQRIEKTVEYINHLSKEPNAFGHYGIHNDCAKWLLNILKGENND